MSLPRSVLHKVLKVLTRGGVLNCQQECEIIVNEHPVWLFTIGLFGLLFSQFKQVGGQSLEQQPLQQVSGSSSQEVQNLQQQQQQQLLSQMNQEKLQQPNSHNLAVPPQNLSLQQNISSATLQQPSVSQPQPNNNLLQPSGTDPSVQTAYNALQQPGVSTSLSAVFGFIYSYMKICDSGFFVMLIELTWNLQAKVSGPNSVNDLKRTPKFEWCLFRCGSKDGYRKDMCLKDLDYVLKIY